MLSMEVLGDPDNVRAIWTEYEASGGNLAKSLQMFEPILAAPVAELPSYLRICDALCGKKTCTFAHKVLDQMEQAKDGRDFITELFGWVSSNLIKLQNQYSNREEVESLCFAFVLFSKIIKQRPELYDRLEKRLFEVIGRYNSHELQFTFE